VPNVSPTPARPKKVSSSAPNRAPILLERREERGERRERGERGEREEREGRGES